MSCQRCQPIEKWGLTWDDAPCVCSPLVKDPVRERMLEEHERLKTQASPEAIEAYENRFAPANWCREVVQVEQGAEAGRMHQCDEHIDWIRRELPMLMGWRCTCGLTFSLQREDGALWGVSSGGLVRMLVREERSIPAPSPSSPNQDTRLPSETQQPTSTHIDDGLRGVVRPYVSHLGVHNSCVVRDIAGLYTALLAWRNAK